LPSSEENGEPLSLKREGYVINAGSIGRETRGAPRQQPFKAGLAHVQRELVKTVVINRKPLTKSARYVPHGATPTRTSGVPTE
jgi:hypothetical protein